MRSLNKKMNKVIIILSFLLAGSNIDANAGEKYKLEVDRFTDIKTSSYKAIPNKECKLTKSLKSRIASCLFINSTESSSYPSISIGTTSDGWDLLSYSGKKTSNAIVTFDDGTTKKMVIPAEYDGDSLYGSTVLEWVSLILFDLKEDLANISKLEFQFGSSEYEWKPDKDLLQKSLSFEE